MSTAAWVTTILGALFGLALAWYGFRAWYYGDGDDFALNAAAPLPAAAAVTGVPEGRLPSAEERTIILSALAEKCPACGGDHPGECDTISDGDVLTGQVISPGTPPSGHPMQYVADTVVSRALASYENQWTMLGGRWVPPASLTRQLRDGDWLTELLLENTTA